MHMASSSENIEKIAKIAGAAGELFCADPDALSEQQARLMLHKVIPRPPSYLPSFSEKR
jgi:hypothetical protein